MKKTADFIIEHRFIIAVIMLVLTIVCAVLTTFIPVNNDRTRYLADDSNMKQGLSILRSDFPEAEEKASIRVMFDDLTGEEIPDILDRLKAIPYVSSVGFAADSEDYRQGNHTLFLVNSTFDYGTAEEKAIEQRIRNGFPDHVMVFQNNDIPTTEVPLWLLLTAVALMIVILLVMCDSWLEPVLFLAATGIAILINMGTNIVFPYIDEMTSSIGPIIQLVLSMDYSIILMNRYRQEKARHADRKDAMKAALSGSVSTIASSSLTTAAGLLALIFLSFRLGPELGIVLAKGVLISMVCVLTILPVLILLCDKWIEKTRKRSPHIPMGFFAAFSRKARRVMPAVFIILFAGFLILQSFTRVSFLENSEDPMEGIFPKENTVVLVYRTEEEPQTGPLIEGLEEDKRVTNVLGYSNTLGKACDASQMSELLRSMQEETAGAGEAAEKDLQIDDSMLRMLYLYYQMQHGKSEMSVVELFDYLCDELLEDARLDVYFNEEMKDYIQSRHEDLENAVSQIKGPDYSRLVITSDYTQESVETNDFIARIRELCDANLSEYYLIGTSVMVSEMSSVFEKEYLLITLITAVVIFLVVLIAFRRPVIPLILTLLVQCGVFITVTVIGAFSGSIYYLALLIVQSILMGATIDYGIVFCSFYKECRKDMDMAASLKMAYERSIHTIMTSGSILVLVLAALGAFAPSAMIVEVCIPLSIGSLVAIVLILIVLPGLIACFDRFIIKRSSG